MRKLLFFLLLVSPLASAQFTLVSGTVKDPNGLAYANGTITPTLVISGSPRFASSGLGYSPPTQATGLDSKGSFAMQLADVNALIPTGGTWSFHVCSAAGTVQPGSPITGGPVCFDVAGIVVTGTTMDISAQLNAAAKPLTALGGGLLPSGCTGTPGGILTCVSFRAGLGARAATSYGFTANPNSGMYDSAANLVWAVNGLDKLQLTSTALLTYQPICDNTAAGCFTFTPTSITSSVPLLAPNGTQAAPSYSFASNPNTGLYTTVGGLLLSVAGITKLQLFGTSITSSVPLLAPDGTFTTPAYSFTSNPGSGMFRDPASGVIGFSNNNNQNLGLVQGLGLRIPNNYIYSWSATGFIAPSSDTGLSRLTPGVVGVGNGTAGSTSGTLQAAAFIESGTAFSSSGGCTEHTRIGGATAGKFTIGVAGSCHTVITMGNSSTAPNGWSCTAIDLTTPSDVTHPHQTATSTTTATIASGIAAASDVIQFSCIGY